MVTLSRSNNEQFGIVIDGNTISEVIKGYPAARTGGLDVGDEILSINKIPVSETDDVSGLLAMTGRTLIMSIYRKGNIAHVYLQ